MLTDSDKKLIRTFDRIIDRCYHSFDKSYVNFGAKGIRISPEWYTPETKKEGMKAFLKWSYENGYSEGKILARIDEEKDYSPENCKWIPKKDATRSSDKAIVVDGKKYTYAQLDKMNTSTTYEARNMKANGWSDKAIVYAAKHPELELRHRDRNGDIYLDKDGFQHLIPKD